MPLPIPNTTVLDAYDESTTFAGNDVLADGFITVANNPVACQLALGKFGQAHWSDEIYLPPSTLPIRPGTRTPVAGIRFRNFVAGSPAQVFGTLFYPGEAGLGAGSPFDSTVSAAGGISPAVTGGRISSLGAVEGGSGFTCNRFAVGSYRITFTAPFAAIPAVVATIATTAVNAHHIRIQNMTVSQFEILISDSGHVSLADAAFNFVVANLA